MGVPQGWEVYTGYTDSSTSFPSIVSHLRRTSIGGANFRGPFYWPKGGVIASVPVLRVGLDVLIRLDDACYTKGLQSFRLQLLSFQRPLSYEKLHHARHRI
ncbi:hypothetical protein QE152_g22119 [Popillia japonica]|uniref:Uncharacterized protein n=1 Tax=Popillia japonica TaxID=7064 RepID=A0AAW1KLU3_POPJA